jgi:hypothetical protein
VELEGKTIKLQIVRSRAEARPCPLFSRDCPFVSGTRLGRSGSAPLPARITAARTPTAQQHDDLAATGRPSPGRTVLRAPVFSAGWLAIRFLISAAMVINASPTLVAFLALVSRKGMPISSAKALAVA